MGACTSKQDVKESIKNSFKPNLPIPTPSSQTPVQTFSAPPVQVSKPPIFSSQNDDLTHFPDFYYFDRAKALLLLITKTQTTEIALKPSFNFPTDSAFTILPSGILLSVGGLIRTSIVKTVFSLDIQSKVINELTNLPLPCKLGNLHAIGDWVYYVGGIKNSKDHLEQAPLLRFSLRLNLWEDLWRYGEQFQFDRIVNMGSCSLGNKLLLVGGQKISSQGIVKNSKKIYSIAVEDGFKVEFEIKIPFKILNPSIANGRKNAVVTGGINPKTLEPNRGSFFIVAQGEGLKIIKVSDVGVNLTEKYPAIYEKDTAIFVSLPYIAVRTKKVNKWIVFEVRKDAKRCLQFVAENRAEDESSEDSCEIEKASRVNLRGERQVSDEAVVRFSASPKKTDRNIEEIEKTERNEEKVMKVEKTERNERIKMDWPPIDAKIIRNEEFKGSAKGIISENALIGKSSGEEVDNHEIAQKFISIESIHRNLEDHEKLESGFPNISEIKYHNSDQESDSDTDSFKGPKRDFVPVMLQDINKTDENLSKHFSPKSSAKNKSFNPKLSPKSSAASKKSPNSPVQHPDSFKIQISSLPQNSDLPLLPASPLNLAPQSILNPINTLSSQSSDKSEDQNILILSKPPVAPIPEIKPSSISAKYIRPKSPSSSSSNSPKHSNALNTPEILKIGFGFNSPLLQNTEKTPNELFHPSTNIKKDSTNIPNLKLPSAPQHQIISAPTDKTGKTITISSSSSSSDSHSSRSSDESNGLDLFTFPAVDTNHNTPFVEFEEKVQKTAVFANNLEEELEQELEIDISPFDVQETGPEVEKKPLEAGFSPAAVLETGKKLNGEGKIGVKVMQPLRPDEVTQDNFSEIDVSPIVVREPEKPVSQLVMSEVMDDEIMPVVIKENRKLNLQLIKRNSPNIEIMPIVIKENQKPVAQLMKSGSPDFEFNPTVIKNSEKPVSQLIKSSSPDFDFNPIVIKEQPKPANTLLEDPLSPAQVPKITSPEAAKIPTSSPAPQILKISSPDSPQAASLASVPQIKTFSPNAPVITKQEYPQPITNFIEDIPLGPDIIPLHEPQKPLQKPLLKSASDMNISPLKKQEPLKPVPLLVQSISPEIPNVLDKPKLLHYSNSGHNLNTVGRLSVKPMQPFITANHFKSEINLLKTPSQPNLFYRSVQPQKSVPLQSQDFGEVYFKTISSKPDVNLLAKINVDELNITPSDQGAKIKIKKKDFFSMKYLQKLTDIISNEFNQPRTSCPPIKTQESLQSFIQSLLLTCSLLNLNNILKGIPLIFQKKDFTHKQILSILTSSKVHQHSNILQKPQFSLAVYKAYKVALLKRD